MTEKEYAPLAFVCVEDSGVPSMDILMVSPGKRAPVSSLKRLPDTVKASPSIGDEGLFIVSVVPTEVRMFTRNLISFVSLRVYACSRGNMPFFIDIAASARDNKRAYVWRMCTFLPIKGDYIIYI